MRPQAKGRLSHQELEAAGRTLPWSLQREQSPADTLILFHRPLASRTGRQHVSEVLSRPIGGSLLQQPQGTNTASKVFPS